MIGSHNVPRGENIGLKSWFGQTFYLKQTVSKKVKIIIIFGFLFYFFSRIHVKMHHRMLHIKVND